MDKARTTAEADATSNKNDETEPTNLEKEKKKSEPLLIAGDLWIISRAANLFGTCIIVPVTILPAKYLPQWLVVGYILVHSFLALRSRDCVLRDDYAMGPAIRLISAVVWLVVMFFILRAVPVDLIIFTHHFLTGSLGSTFNTYMNYLNLDEPSISSAQMCILSRDSCMEQLVCTALYVYRSEMKRPATLIWYWLILPSFSVAVTTWLCLRAGGKVREITRIVLAIIRVNIMRIFWWNDVLDVMWMATVQTHDNASYRNLHDLAERKRELHIDLPVYEYRPLRPGQIRLLVITPSGYYDRGLFIARLVHVDVSSLPAYEAISYQWADTTTTDEILVDYQSFPLTRSALDVLRCRRRWFKPRTIWLDAICINQANPEEKASQVQLMRHIYAQAYRVVVFPGFEPELRLVHDLIYEEAATLARYGTGDSFFNFRPLLANGNFAARWKAWKALLFSDYFGRAWIVQEIAVAQDAQLYLHGFYVPWKWFMRAAARLGDPFKMGQLELAGFTDESVAIGGKTVPGVMNALAYIDALRENDSLGLKMASFETGAHRHIEHLLEFTAGAKATDPRDHIFAIIGLAKGVDTGDALLKPNYTKPVAQVFEDAARHLFVDQQTPSLRLLGRAGIGYTKLKRKVPSWVPDWSEARISVPHNQVLIQRKFNACGDRHAIVHSQMVAHGELALKGIFIDDIQDISECDIVDVDTPPGVRIHALESLRKKLAYLLASHSFLALHAVRLTDVDVPKDLYRLLTVDHIEDELITENFKDIFQQWIDVTRYTSGATDYMDMVKRSNEVVGEDIWAPALPMQKGDVHAGGLMNVWNQAFSSACMGRRVAVSGGGKPCLVPMMSQRGDSIFVPFGSASPFVVRRDGDGKKWQLVGEAYVHGSMYGEAMDQSVDDNASWITLR